MSAQQQRVVVTLTDDVVEDHEKVQKTVSECEANGLCGIELLRHSGIILGTIDTDRKEPLKKVRGVASVEDDEKRSPLS